MVSEGLRFRKEEQDSVLLVRQLLLGRGLLGDGLQAAAAPGLRGTGGAAPRASFAQVAGERGVVDLLQVLLDLDPSVFQQVLLTLRRHWRVYLKTLTIKMILKF